MARRRLNAAQRDDLFAFLGKHFKDHPDRHDGLSSDEVVERVQAAAPKTLWSLAEMERTGGEPDVIGRDPQSGAVEFVDCSAESPAEIRVHGGAIFGHVRFEHVFICPNGAQSLSGSRGFPGRLLV